MILNFIIGFGILLIGAVASRKLGNFLDIYFSSEEAVDEAQDIINQKFIKS